MTSKEANKKARERAGLPLNTECAIITDEELKVIEKDLEVLEQLETLKNYYPPFKEFLEEMFKNGYNEDLTKVKEWLENDK